MGRATKLGSTDTANLAAITAATEGVVSASNAAAVTPHDTNLLSNTTRAIYVGGAGNLKVTMVGGGDVTFSGLAAGSLLPVRATRVFATLTTATLIVALW